MSNRPDATASREEEIAFLAMEEVLGVSITLADAGGGSKMPDGVWTSAVGRCIVEVTSPPAKELMAEWARAKREGEAQSESGSVSLRLNQLADVCTELLGTDWAIDNIEKLRAQPAEERHLFLFARSYDAGNYFYRLSDPQDGERTEQIKEIVLPDGISDVWFRGRASRDPQDPHAKVSLRLARFNSGFGWQRYSVEIEELRLPSPNPGITDDLVPSSMRRPRDRT